MAKRGALARRPVGEWGVRLALAAVATGIAYGSISRSTAYMLRGKAPEQAYALAPEDGRIGAILSEKLSGAEADSAERNRSDMLARQALRHDPTAVSAVATLGINAQIRENTAAARRIFAYADKLSRRDLRTRLWAIEDAVARNDIAGALRNYDTALRTSRVAADLLFPVLASAITNSDIRSDLIRLLGTRPIWGDHFVTYLAVNGPDTRATASVLATLRSRGMNLPEGTEALLIPRLLAAGQTDDAWTYYRSMRRGVDRQMSRDANFEANLTLPSPFDWTPITDSGISTTIQHGENSGLVDISVPPNLGGPLLRQTQVLSPGNYVIEGHSIAVEGPNSDYFYWTLTCGDGRELGRVPVPASSRQGGRFTGQITVPTACPVQQFMLVAKPTDQMSGLTGQIDFVRLRPAGR
ncbi:hypothetical protein [Sphingomonas hankookensis]|uniref:Uncharacterized protein n=1 Tax=Sphingomonas hankookensis TaxID=563996 RepID=A0ABR5YCH6_9SPHN|nr:hypothetical protein [Sphingomonas hankookensis]KZE13274.1 hypothetical protein AVT10_03640 [Sphingomonas hankookensis]